MLIATLYSLRLVFVTFLLCNKTPHPRAHWACLESWLQRAEFLIVGKDGTKHRPGSKSRKPKGHIRNYKHTDKKVNWKWGRLLSSPIPPPVATTSSLATPLKPLQLCYQLGTKNSNSEPLGDIIPLYPHKCLISFPRGRIHFWEEWFKGLDHTNVTLNCIHDPPLIYSFFETVLVP